ncbi:MAG: hypothetical protein WCF85_06250 [Rhodospirillaceae bacterium]
MAKRPLNKAAVKAANQSIYSLTGGRGLTLSTKDASLREMWMDAYLTNGGELDTSEPGNCVGKTVSTCSLYPVVGKAWKSAAEAIFPGKQSYQNCGIQSARQIIEQANIICLVDNELEFLNKAINSCSVDKADNHPIDSGGSNAENRQCILSQYGVDSIIEDASVGAVDQALRERKGVIISTDVSVLWSGLGISQAGRHAVVVTHGKYDDDGKMEGVYINDTGVGKQYYITSDALKDALESGAGSMNVTSKPIWPSD